MCNRQEEKKKKKSFQRIGAEFIRASDEAFPAGPDGSHEDGQRDAASLTSVHRCGRGQHAGTLPQFTSCVAGSWGGGAGTQAASWALQALRGPRVVPHGPRRVTGKSRTQALV